MLASITVLVGDSDREREAQFPLAVSVYEIGCHVRLVDIEFVLHSFTFLGDVNDRCGNITSTADDAFVVERAVGK